MSEALAMLPALALAGAVAGTVLALRRRASRRRKFAERKKASAAAATADREFLLSIKRTDKE